LRRWKEKPEESGISCWCGSGVFLSKTQKGVNENYPGAEKKLEDQVRFSGGTVLGGVMVANRKKTSKPS